MAIKYSCFISYRHGQSQLAERIINDLSSALSNELELFTNKEIYIDRQRLRGGDFYNEELARAICESVCMIVVFTPTYFDVQSPFCAREFKAMEKLEEARLKVVQKFTGKKCGFIIPIIFRGEKSLPDIIRDSRHYYNFGDFLLCDVELSKHPDYARKIKEIAETIFSIYELLIGLPEDSCAGCDTFALPSEEDVKHWLGSIRSAPPLFPGRSYESK